MTVLLLLCKWKKKRYGATAYLILSIGQFTPFWHECHATMPLRSNWSLIRLAEDQIHKSQTIEHEDVEWEMIWFWDIPIEVVCNIMCHETTQPDILHALFDGTQSLQWNLTPSVPLIDSVGQAIWSDLQAGSLMQTSQWKFYLCTSIDVRYIDHCWSSIWYCGRWSIALIDKLGNGMCKTVVTEMERLSLTLIENGEASAPSKWDMCIC